MDKYFLSNIKEIGIKYFFEEIIYFPLILQYIGVSFILIKYHCAMGFLCFRSHEPSLTTQTKMADAYEVVKGSLKLKGVADGGIKK